MKRGFTLVEILVSIAILSIVIAGIFAVLNLGDMTWHSDTGLLYLQQGVRQAMDTMVREIRQSRAIDISDDETEIQFEFPLTNITTNTTDPFTCFATITYQRNTDNDNNQLVRKFVQDIEGCPTEPAEKVLANNINFLYFPPLSGDIVEIQLSAQKTVRGRVLSFPVSGALTEQVRLRNE